MFGNLSLGLFLFGGIARSTGNVPETSTQGLLRSRGLSSRLDRHAPEAWKGIVIWGTLGVLFMALLGGYLLD